MIRSSRQHVRRNRRPGFTLVEVLVVVALIALIGGTGIGMYANSYKRMLLDKAARELMLAAKYARVMAIEQQEPFKLEYDPQNHQFAVTTVLWDETTGESNLVVINDYYCKPIQLPENVQIEAFVIASTQVDISGTSAGSDSADTANPAAITFLPNGTADAAAVQLGDGNTHYTISVAPNTGKASVIFGTADQIKSKVIDLEEQEQ